MNHVIVGLYWDNYSGNISLLIHWPLGDVEVIFEQMLQINFKGKLLSGEYHTTNLMISQDWFR